MSGDMSAVVTAEYEKYRAYLLESPRWKALVKRVIKKQNYRCAYCGEGGKVLQGHHLNYIHLFEETEEDIIAVCLECHPEMDAMRQNEMKERRKAAVFGTDIDYSDGGRRSAELQVTAKFRDYIREAYDQKIITWIRDWRFGQVKEDTPLSGDEAKRILGALPKIERRGLVFHPQFGTLEEFKEYLSALAIRHAWVMKMNKKAGYIDDSL